MTGTTAPRTGSVGSRPPTPVSDRVVAGGGGVAVRVAGCTDLSGIGCALEGGMPHVS